MVNNYPENGRTGSLKIGLKSVIAELGRIQKTHNVSYDRPLEKLLISVV